MGSGAWVGHLGESAEKSVSFRLFGLTVMFLMKASDWNAWTAAVRTWSTRTEAGRSPARPRPPRKPGRVVVPGMFGTCQSLVSSCQETSGGEMRLPVRVHGAARGSARVRPHHHVPDGLKLVPGAAAGTTEGPGHLQAKCLLQVSDQEDHDSFLNHASQTERPGLTRCSVKG